MDDNVTSPVVQQNPENFYNAGGCPITKSSAIPSQLLRRDGYPITQDELDEDSLRKLQAAGIDEDDLDSIYNKYGIPPIRTADDIFRFVHISPSSNYRKIISEKHCTAIGFLTPNVCKPGEVLPYTHYARVRLRVDLPKRGGGKYKYLQPDKEHTTRSSEPYFLMIPEMWGWVRDASMPLIETEGALKAIALGLAGYAAIGFPGVTMWRAPTSAGKDIIHPTLDPKLRGPIPILDRDIYILPDTDYHTKSTVGKQVRKWGQVHHVAGASSERVKIAFIPIAPNGEWKDIDEYLYFHLGPRWSRNRKDQARELVDNILGGKGEVIRSTSILLATGTTRCAERIVEQLEQPNDYTVVMQASGQDGLEDVGWARYRVDRYMLDKIRMTSGASCKMTNISQEFRKLVTDDYKLGQHIARQEDPDASGKEKDMSDTHVNIVLAKVDTDLPRVCNNMVMEPFAGVQDGDSCLRICGALINLTKAFRVKLDWGKRGEWLLPSDYRWFSVGSLNVSLFNLTEYPQCPLFLEFLNNAFNGDKEKISCLQLWFGKIVLSPMLHDLQQFLCLYGTAGSGKSTIEDLMITMLGPTEVVNIRGDFSSRFELSNAPGKKLIVFSETQDGDNKGLPQSLTNAIKSITGGDLTTIEVKGKTPVDLRLNAEIVLVSNNIIEMKMETEAFKRRVVFLSTTKKIDNPSREKRLAMFAELPGIFLWALRGAMYLKAHPEHRIETPQACVADLEEATEDVSPETTFVRQRVMKAESGILTYERLEDGFQEWLRDTKRKVYSIPIRKLARLVRDNFAIESTTVREKDKVVRAFKGLALSPTNVYY